MTKAKKVFFSIFITLVFSVTIILTSILIVGNIYNDGSEEFVEEKVPFARANYDLSQTIPEDSLEFTYDSSNHTATFVGIRNSGQHFASWKDKTLNIPSTVEYSGDTYTVTAIDTASSQSFTTISNTQGNAPYPFYSKLQAYGSGITAIIVPSTVTSMNSGAFYGCASLVYLEVPFLGTEKGCDNATAGTNNASLHSLFSPAYTSASNTGTCKYFYLGDVKGQQLGTVNQSTRRSWYLVDGSSSTASLWYELPCNLQDVKVTNDSELITRAFYNIDSLVNVSLNEGLDTIGEYAFASCDNLENVHLPKDIGLLPRGLFSECRTLGTTSAIYLPATIRSIPDSCFGGCTNLKKVYMPTTVDDIFSKAFEDCNNLEYIVLYNGFKLDESYNTTTNPEIKGFNLPSGLKTIGASAFAKCTLMTSIAVPTTVTKIDKLAFAGNPNMTSISLPFVGTARGTSGVASTDFGYIFSWNSIDDNFYGATQAGGTYYIPKKLDSIVILGETYVKTKAFANLAYTKTDQTIGGVSAIVLNDDVTTVESGAFSGCGALANITVPFVGTTIDDSSNFSIIFGNSIPSIGTYDNATGYYIPNSLINIKVLKANVIYTSQFANLYFIQKVEFPKDVSEMRESIFYNNQRLKTLILPYVGKNVGIWHPRWPDYGWSWWHYDVERRNSLMWIFSGGSAAGHYCLTDLSYGYTNRFRYIPESLQNIEILNDTAIDTWAFRNFKSLKTIKLNSQTYGNTLSYVESSCMYGCSNLETLDVPFIGYNTNAAGNNGAEHTIGWYFGEGEFNNSYYAGGYRNTFIPNSLKKVIVDGGANLTAINAYAFYGMKSLESVDFKTNNISQIGWAAFAGCEKLANFSYGEATSFTAISGYAFYNCKNVIELHKAIPMYKAGSQISLGEYALAGSGVSEIDFGRISALGKYCLSNCLNLTTAHLTTNISSIGEGVFADCTFLNDVQLQDGLSSKNLFKNCLSLTQIDISSAARTIIPEGMFDGCENLLYNRNEIGGLIYNKETVTEIGANAFRNCKSLENFELPTFLKTIRSGAFFGDTKLSSLVIPRTVETINSGVFTPSQGEDFIIWVYQTEADRPATWTTNWNCDNIVMVIDALDDSNYEFEFDTTLRGYVITAVKSGVLLNENVYLPTTHLSCTVVGIKGKVFEHQTDVKTIVVPLTYVTYGNNCFNNLNRVDLYFVSSKANTTSKSYTIYDGENSYDVLGNENKLISCGCVYYGDYWKFESDNITPSLNISSITFSFKKNAAPVYSGIAWDNTNYPIVKAVTPAVLVENATIDNSVTNVLFDVDDNNATWRNLFNYKYSDNVYASVNRKAKVEISLVGARYQEYLASNPYAMHLNGTAKKDFSIGKATIELFYDKSQATNYFMRKFSKVYDGNQFILNVGSYNDSTYMSCITIKDFLSLYTVTGTIYSQSANAGTYEAHAEQYNSYVRRDITVRTKSNSVDVTSSFNIMLYVQFTISPMEVELHFAEGFENGDVYEYEYNGYQKSPKLVAKAYPFGQPEAAPINDCYVSAYATNAGMGWVPGDTIYYAFAELKNVGYNRLNYVVKEVNGVTCTTTNDVTGIYQKIKIVKAKIYINILDKNYLIDADAECWSFDAWSTNRSYYTITGLKEDTKLVGKLVSNSNVANKTAYEQAEYKTGDSELDIIWQPANYSDVQGGANANYHLYTEIQRTDSQGQAYTEYYSEMDYYETIVVNADVFIKYNDFSIVVRIGDSTYTYPMGKETIDGVGYSKIVYYTDGQRVPVEILIRNKDKNGNTILATLTYSEATLDSTNQVMVGDVITDNVPVTFKYKLQRLRFNKFDDNLAIYVYKRNVSIISDITKEYDRQDYSISADMKYIEHIDANNRISIFREYDVVNLTALTYDVNIYYVKDLSGNYVISTDPFDATKTYYKSLSAYGTDQIITTTILDKNKNPIVDNPIAPGVYYIHVVATEGAYFNACDTYIKLTITKRTITIYLDRTNSADQYSLSKTWGYYTGQPYTVTINSSDLITYNGLLSGDTFYGQLITKSDLPGVYTSDLDSNGRLKDWTWSPQWSIYDSSYSLISEYYNVVVTGSYEIKKLVMTVSSSGYSGNYDTLAHGITVNVSVPLTGYTIYYSTDCPSSPDEFGNDGARWSTVNPLYISPNLESPGYYRVYYKVVCANYETKYGYEDVRIISLSPTHLPPQEFISYTPSASSSYTGDYYISYDWFPHSLELESVVPRNATVQYCLVHRGQNPGTYTTNIPYVTDEGEYTLYYKITCHDYETVTGSYLFVVTNEFNSEFVEGTDYNVLLDNVIYSSSNSTFTYQAGLTHTISAEFVTTQDNGSILYSLDGNNWTSDPVTIINADTYRIYYRLRARNKQTKEGYVDVTINPATFDNVTVTDYNAVYDGEYHTVTINGLDVYQTAGYTLYYAKVFEATYYDVTNSLWSTNIDFIKYKDVCNNKQVYIRVVAPNYQTLTLSTGLVTITQCTPIVTFNNGCEVEYKADKVNISDLDITTIHDGNTIATWYVATYDPLGNPVYSHQETPADQLNVAPTELGCYFVKISYRATANCTAVETSGYFRIVPRKVTLTYASEKQYTGEFLSPDFVVTTGTRDTLSVLFQRADGVAELPKELGQYKLYVSFATTVTNYVLDLPYDVAPNDTKQYVIFTVTQREITIVADIVKPYDGSIWEMQSIRDSGSQTWNNIWTSYVTPNPGGLVQGHIFTAHMYTNSSIRGTYIYSTLSTALTLMRVVVEDVCVYDSNGNDVSAYYNINFDIKVKIKLPDLNATFEDLIVPYDGYEHSIDAVIPANVDINNLIYYYKYSDIVGNDTRWQYTTGWLTNPRQFTNVGTYDIYIWISSLDYDDFYAKATLTITKTNLNIVISPFDVIYDNNDHIASFSVSNCQTIDQSLANVKYYSTNDVTLSELRALYTSFGNTNPNYNLYLTKAKTSMVNAGDYYMVVYFPETVNYYASYNNFDIVTIQRRPVYFSTAINLAYTKVYDGTPYEITLGSNFVYDTGLLAGHNFDSSALIIAGTKSPNAGIYYSDDGTNGRGSYVSLVYSPSNPNGLIENSRGFVFTSAFIYNSFGENMVDNYMPVIYNDALVVLIERADIPDGVFNANDLEREYDGTPAFPTVNSPSDGEFTTTVYKATEINGVSSYDANQLCYSTDVQGSSLNCCNVGYYYVIVSQGVGTNYNAPNYTVGAYVRITKKTVEAVWPEDKLTVEFNGQAQAPVAYYEDINGDHIPLNVCIMVNWNPYQEVINAGVYVVTADNATDTNYNVINRGENNNTISFTITQKEYTIYLYASGTSGRYITYDGVDRSWSKYIDGSYFNNANSDYTGDNWLTGLTLQRSPSDAQTAIIETLNHTPGTYYGDDMFIFTYAVLTSNGLDVTDSIKFVVDGGVIIMSNKIDYIIMDNGNITVPYKGTPYDIWDFVTLINPTSHTKLSKLLFSTDGDFEKSTITSWSRTNVGTELVYFMFEYGGDQQVKDKFTVHIVANDPYIKFNKTFDKKYDATAVTPETIKNGISAAQYNGIENGSGYANLNFTYYLAGDLDHPIAVYDNGPLVSGSCPTSSGDYMVKITSSYDEHPENMASDYVANYTTLEVWVSYTISPSDVSVQINEEYLVFLGTSSANSGQFGSAWTKEIAISNNATIPTGYTALLTFTIVSGTASDNTTYQGIQRGIYTYTGKIIYDPQATSYQIQMIFTPYDTNISPYDVTFNVEWKIYREYTITNTQTNQPETHEENISYNYDLNVDFTLEAHYPKMNYHYSVVNSDNTTSPYYLDAKIDNVDKAFTGNPIYGSVTTTHSSNITYANIQFVDNYATNNVTGSYTVPNISDTAVAPTNPGTHTIYYKFEATGFEPFYGSYEIKIGYIDRRATENLQTTAAGEIFTDPTTNINYASAEYDGGAFSIVLTAASDNKSAGIAFYNHNGVKVADLYTVDTNNNSNVDSYQNYTVYFTKLGSVDELLTITDAGRYNYYIKIPSSTYYKEITITGIVVITKKVVNVGYSGQMTALGNGDQVPGYVAGYNGLVAQDTISLANTIYTFTYSNSTTVNDLDISCNLKTNSWATGVYSISAGNLIVSGTRITKNLVDVSNNYQLSLDDNIRITIDKGTITPASFTTSFVYDGRDQMFTALSGNPTEATITYASSSNGTFGTRESVAQHKPGNYSIFVKFKAANYYDLIREYTLTITKAPIDLDLSSVIDKEYNGDGVNYGANLRATSGVAPSSVTYARLTNGQFVNMSDEIPVDVGRYKIIVYVPEDPNGYYQAGYFEKEFSIFGRQIGLVWKNTTLIYNGESQCPTVEINDATLQAQLESSQITLNYTFTPLTSASGGLDFDHVKVGTYRVEVSVLGSNNFDFDQSTTYTLFQIVARQVTITLNQYASYDENASPYVFVYEELDPITNLLIGYQAVNIVSTHHMGTSTLECRSIMVGAYTDRQSFFWNSARGSESPVILDGNYNDVTDNYQIIYSLNFVINHSTIVPTITNYTGVYDGDNHSIEVVVNTMGTGFRIEYTDQTDSSVPANPINYSTTKPMYKNAGTYTVYVKISKTGYADFYGSGTVTINKADANIAWANEQTPYTLTKVYDALAVDIPAVVSDITPTPEFTYTYSKKNEQNIFEVKCVISVRGNTRNIVSGSVPSEVGNYHLEVSIGSSNNYNSGEIDTYFDIEQREITISLASPIVTDSKEYDGYRWSADETSPKLNINNVVSGQTFSGIVQTISADVSLYENQTDFEWLNNWKVNLGTSDVSSNYYVTFNLSVRITTARMQVVVTDYDGEYDGNQHYIRIRVTEPAGGYVMVYTTQTDGSSNPMNYQTSRIGQTNTGLTTVYFKITCPNYDDYIGHGTIKIRPLSTDGRWVSFVDDYEYDGQAYSNPAAISLNTSTPVYKYYLASDFDTNTNAPLPGKTYLSSNPVNVGNYIVTAQFADDGQYDEFMLVGSFEISKKTVTVNWSSLSVSYTGEEQTPTASYTDVNGNVIALNVDTNVNTMKNVGNYSVTASFDITDTGSSNYQLDNATKSATFEITKKLVTVPNISNNLEFTYGDDIIIKDVDGNTYTLGSDGTIEKIYYLADPTDPTSKDYIIDYVNQTKSTINDPNDPTANVIDSISVEGFVYKLILSSDKNADGVVIQNHTITMKLDDYSNYEWDGVTSPGTDQLRVYRINRETFGANSKYDLVITCEKANATFTYTGDDITPTYTLTVKERGTNNVVRTLYTTFTNGEFAGYTIAMSDNKEVGTASVEFTGMNNYDFSKTKNFTIIDQAPAVIELVAGDKVHFMKAEVDTTTLETTFTETGIVRDTAYQDDIYLSGIHHETFIIDIIPAFSNDSTKLKVYSNSDELLYDCGSIIVNGVDNSLQYICTGYYVVLVDDGGNEVDRIYVIVFGDINGDGLIDATDLEIHIGYTGGTENFDVTITIADMISGSATRFETIYYLSMYTIRYSISQIDGSIIVQTIPDATTMEYIIKSIAGSVDFNSDYDRNSI